MVEAKVAGSGGAFAGFVGRNGGDVVRPFAQLLGGISGRSRRQGHAVVPVAARDFSGEGGFRLTPDSARPVEAVFEAFEIQLQLVQAAPGAIALNRIYRRLSVDSVVADDVEGVRVLVERLVELGNRRLAWVNDYYDVSFFEARQTGFIQGCLGAHLPLKEQQFFGVEIFEGHALRTGEELIEAVGRGATALVCANDFVARHVIKALEDGGLRVPTDVSVTGFDAIPPQQNAMQITSFDPNFFEMGRAAVRLATQRRNAFAPTPSILSIRGEVVTGQTVFTAGNFNTNLRHRDDYQRKIEG